MIHTHEDEEAYYFLVKALCTFIENVFLFIFEPDYIMIDFCQSEYNAFTRWWVTVLILFCFFHLKKNEKKKLKCDPETKD